jgi:hypothetical protein
LFVNVTPRGACRCWRDDIAAFVGVPVVVTVNDPAVPAEKVALFALVIAGGAFTVSVKPCVAFGATPLLAVIVIGKCPARSASRRGSRCRCCCS